MRCPQHQPYYCPYISSLLALVLVQWTPQPLRPCLPLPAATMRCLLSVTSKELTAHCCWLQVISKELTVDCWPFGHPWGVEGCLSSTYGFTLIHHHLSLQARNSSEMMMTNMMKRIVVRRMVTPSAMFNRLSVAHHDRNINSGTADRPTLATVEQLDWLSAVVSGLIDKL